MVTVNRALFLLLMVIILLAAVPPTNGADRPNVVVVLVDDLRWDELSCAGHPGVRTANIDRIAYEGARFRNAFATTPLCSPSRASLLTGNYPQRHGILDNTDRSSQSHRLPTFPCAMQEAGYRTAFIGKWHMGNDDSPRPGFDHWFGLRGQGSSFDPVVNENGNTHQLQGYTTDLLNAAAVEFIQQQDVQSFCLYLSHKALHPELVQYDDGSLSDPSAARFMPAPRHRSLYSDTPVPRRLNAMDPLDGKPALQRPIDGLPPLSLQTGTSDDTVRDRWRMLAAVDEGVGDIIRLLEQTDRLKDTILVFTSDHGYWYGEHGLSVERRLAYEEAIRIPLLIRDPGMVTPGTLVDEMVLRIDLAPTILARTGVASPERRDGRSLLPLLQGEAPKDWRSSFLIEYYSDTVFPRIHRMGYQAVRSQRYKYIRYRELRGMDEFYDLLVDPYEMRNQIDEPGLQQVVDEMRTELDRLVSQEHAR